MSKIDVNGNFLEFHGVNVISLTQPQDNRWQALFNLLESIPLINNNYSLLPFNSYHMTINNLYTKEDEETASNIDWNDFISNNLVFFQTLNYYLQKMSLTPQVIILNTIVTEGVIQLQLSLSPEQISMIDNFTTTHKLENRRPQTFHMTLAYQKPIKSLRFAEYEQIKKIILRNVHEIFAQDKINLLPPKLCYFNSMTKFLPWDGMDNPFSKQTKQHAFFGHHKHRLEEEINETSSSKKRKRN